MRLFPLFALALALCVTTSIATGGAQVYFDRAAWQNQLTFSTTIDFTGWPGQPFGPLITDQYSHLGVIFTDGNDHIVNDKDPNNPDTYLNDGSGLRGGWNNQINMTFDRMQYGVGIDFWGGRFLLLYRGNDLVYQSNPYGSSPMFVGLLFSEGFDRVRIQTPTLGAVSIDDLHFGVPAPGALGVFGLAGLLSGSRRRRS